MDKCQLDDELEPVSSYVYKWERDYLVNPWYYREKKGGSCTNTFGYFHGYDPLNDQLHKVGLEIDMATCSGSLFVDIHRYNTYRYETEIEDTILLCNDGTTSSLVGKRKGGPHSFLNYAAYSGITKHDEVDGFAACAAFFPCKTDKTYSNLI